MSAETAMPQSDEETPFEHGSLVVSFGATLLAALVVGGFALLSEAGAWVGGAGAVLLAFGAFGGVRGLVGWGVGLIAAGALFATNGDPLPFTIAVTAAVAATCLVILLAADMSFSMRRAAVISPTTLQGFAKVHTIAALIGIAIAAVLVSAVLAVSWPGWLLLLPAVVLGAGSFVMARQASRYNRKLRPVPQPRPGMAVRMPPPPPPGIRSTMPPPPAPGARPTQVLPPPPPR